MPHANTCLSEFELQIYFADYVSMFTCLILLLFIKQQNGAGYEMSTSSLVLFCQSNYRFYL